MTEIRPATAEDFVRLRASTPKTARAYVAVRGEEVIGVGGVYRDGVSLVVFSELTDTLRKDRRTMVRLKRAVIPMIQPRTLAFADPDIDGSDALLEHMGFEPLDGRIYQWPG